MKGSWDLTPGELEYTYRVRRMPSFTYSFDEFHYNSSTLFGRLAVSFLRMPASFVLGRIPCPIPPQVGGACVDGVLASEQGKSATTIFPPLPSFLYHQHDHRHPPPSPSSGAQRMRVERAGLQIAFTITGDVARFVRWPSPPPSPHCTVLPIDHKHCRVII